MVGSLLTESPSIDASLSEDTTLSLSFLARFWIDPIPPFCLCCCLLLPFDPFVDEGDPKLLEGDSRAAPPDFDEEEGEETLDEGDPSCFDGDPSCCDGEPTDLPSDSFCFFEGEPMGIVFSISFKDATSTSLIGDDGVSTSASILVFFFNIFSLKPDSMTRFSFFHSNLFRMIVAICSPFLLDRSAEPKDSFVFPSSSLLSSFPHFRSCKQQMRKRKRKRKKEQRKEQTE